MNSVDVDQIRKRIFTLALPLLLIVCGAYLLCDASLALLRAQTSGNWPTTLARIEGERHCCLESQKAAFWYTYYVDGTVYSGATTDLPELSADQIQEAVELHKSVPVHYDPHRPEISVLNPGFAGSLLIWLLAGLLYSSCGAAGLWHHLHRAHTPAQVRLRYAA